MAENTSYIVAAFAVTWISLLGYAFHLHRVRSEAERRFGDATHDAATGGRH